MRIKVWVAVTDGGDGEHHSHLYKSKQEMIDDLGLTGIDVELENCTEGQALDEYDYNVDFHMEIFDTDGYEVVE